MIAGWMPGALAKIVADFIRIGIGTSSSGVRKTRASSTTRADGWLGVHPAWPCVARRHE